MSFPGKPDKPYTFAPAPARIMGSKAEYGKRRHSRCWRGGMARLNGMMAQILRQVRAMEDEEKRQERAARDRIIAAGPPPHTPAGAWEHWLRYGFIACPGRRADRTCDAEKCRIGSRCRSMAERGLFGDGSPMPRKSLPECGAKTRRGDPCAMKVVPGKRRCRLHGGLSTGPKTDEGRERIREAQYVRHGSRADKQRANIEPARL